MHEPTINNYLNKGGKEKRELFENIEKEENEMKIENEEKDDMDFQYDKVKCWKIEGLMPRLMGMVESEMEGMR